MIFSDTSTKQGLIQDCERRLFTDYGTITNNSDLLKDMTNRINRAYDSIATIIMSVDGRWQWDDSNYTDLPVGTTTMTANQADYSLDVEYMDVLKVLILDTNGNKMLLSPIDMNDPVCVSYLEDTATPQTGMPIYYDKRGASIILLPTPNYTKAAGIIVHFQRKPSYFTYTDTTKAPGLPAIFHRYLALEASLDYAIDHSMSIKNDLAQRLAEVKLDVADFMSKRAKDEIKKIRAVDRSYQSR